MWEERKRKKIVRFFRKEKNFFSDFFAIKINERAVER